MKESVQYGWLVTSHVTAKINKPILRFQAVVSPITNLLITCAKAVQFCNPKTTYIPTLKMII